MGWLYGWPSREDLIRHLTEETRWVTNDGHTRTTKTLHKTLRGNTLWTVRETKRSEDPHATLWIGCDLLRTCLVSPRDDYPPQWGYKDMDESMGPTEVSCPLKYIVIVPCPVHGYARDWRERVKKHHEQRRERQRLRRERLK